MRGLYRGYIVIYNHHVLDVMQMRSVLVILWHLNYLLGKRCIDNSINFYKNTDIYSLGVTLYFMLTYDVPYRGLEIFSNCIRHNAENKQR